MCEECDDGWTEVIAKLATLERRWREEDERFQKSCRRKRLVFTAIQVALLAYFIALAFLIGFPWGFIDLGLATMPAFFAVKSWRMWTRLIEDVK